MARKFTAAERNAIRARMKAYWAKKRKAGHGRPAGQPPVATHVSSPTAWAEVRVIATHDGQSIVATHRIQSIGGLVDLLGEGYTGLSEVLIRIL